MGLTIQYHLKADPATSEDVLVGHLNTLRNLALDRGFKEVGKVITLEGAKCDYNNYRTSDKHLCWPLIQAGIHVDAPDGRSFGVAPNKVILLSTWPGEGCEEANFGFCSYPASYNGIKIENPKWRWGSFCKTQYACNISLENFLRCHTRVIELLDKAKELGILGEVSDEGNYWEKRDLEALAKEVVSWNEMIAGMFGKIQEAITGKDSKLSIVAPITENKAFEHLEAKGVDRLNKMGVNL